MNTRKILIIDDEIDLLDSIKELLEFEGYQVLVAKDGVAGLELATNEHPDLILLDVVMSLMSGDEVLQQIKDRGIPTRVIMISAKRKTVKDSVKFIKLGACDYIIKPFSHQELVDPIRRALAVDKTINLEIRNNPTVKELLATVQKLQSDNEKLQNDNIKIQHDLEESIKSKKKLEQRLKEKSFVREYVQYIIWLGINLVCLAIIGGIISLLVSLSIVPKNLFLITWIVTFLLISIRVHRIQKLSVKVPEVEADIEMDDDKR